MACIGQYQIENKYYRFNSDGTLASAGWYLDSDGSWYYVDESGAVATGDTLINGTLYRFANNGRLKTGVIVEDGKCNLYNDDGVKPAQHRAGICLAEIIII